MARTYIDNIRRSLEARDMRERAVLLALALIVLGYLWLVLALDPLNAREQTVEGQIALAEGQIRQQEARQQEIRDSYSDDPDSFARTRVATLRRESAEVDERLDRLYGQLIPPRQMSLVLTSILQRETSLRLLSLANLRPESLFSGNVESPAAGGAGEARSGGMENMRVYKHGLRMEFEGSYLETLRYLRSLEALDSNFFWENLRFELNDYPMARITLDIFTLSTQEGWIGV